MRKIIFLMHVSLDGYVAGPNGEMDWIRYDKSLEDYAHSLHDSTDTAIYGRVTYEMMAGYWPGVLTDPTSDEGALNHARWVDQATKVVVSTTLESTDWQPTIIIKENVAEAIRKLKQQDGKDMWLLGSPTLAQYMMAHNLIDEYRLTIHPVIVGSGVRLFATQDHVRPLKLVDSQTFSSGVLAVCYVLAEES